MTATRGPWLYDAGDSGDDSVGMAPTPPAIYADPDNSGNVYPICTLDDPRRKADRDLVDEYDDGTETDGDIASNAALICAAPLLRDSLRELLEAFLSITPENNRMVAKRFSAAFDAANAALIASETSL